MSKQILAYVIAIICVVFTSLIGGIFTSKSVKSPWYDCIKSDVTPPNYVFPIAWTILYILIAIALARSIKKRNQTILILFGMNLLFNIIWCYLYFGAKQIVWGMISLIILVIMTILLIFKLYLVKDYVSMSLLIPYLLWLLFASLLNFLSIKKSKSC